LMGNTSYRVWQETCAVEQLCRPAEAAKRPRRARQPAEGLTRQSCRARAT
jgi:hypothetical protein